MTSLLTPFLEPVFGVLDSLGPEMSVAALAGLAAFLGLVAVWRALLSPDPMAKRLKQLAVTRAAIRTRATADGKSRHRKSRGAVTTIHGLVRRLDLMRGEKAKAIGVRLARAGHRSKDAMAIYLGIKLLLPLAVGAVAVLLLFVFDLYPIEVPVKALIAGGAVLAVFYLPEIWVRNLTDKRRKALERGLPDALDLLVICTEAGLALDAALDRVADESGKSAPEIADEFGLTSVELGFLPDRRTALDNLSTRTGLASIRGMVNALVQTEKYGTPLAQSLRVLSAEYRNERMMKAEEKAARLPATLTVPLILFILPSLFVVLLGPAIIGAIDGLGGLS